jgi:hypothetical protein
MKDLGPKGELIGNVALKTDRPVDRASGGEKQMSMLAEINNHPDVKCRADIGEIGLIDGLMRNFRADEHIGQNLFLQHSTEKAPILMATEGIDAVTATAVNRPRSQALLQPDRQEGLQMAIAKRLVRTARGQFEQRKNSQLWQHVRFLAKPVLRAELDVSQAVMVGSIGGKSYARGAIK